MSLCAVLAFPIEEKVRQETLESTINTQKDKPNKRYILTKHIDRWLFYQEIVPEALNALILLWRKPLRL